MTERETMAIPQKDAQALVDDWRQEGRQYLSSDVGPEVSMAVQQLRCATELEELIDNAE